LLSEEIESVDTKIIVGERKKRPYLYSRALKSLLSNSALLNAELIRKALDKSFLKLVISEVLVKSRDAQLRLLNEVVSGKDKSISQVIGLNYLEGCVNLLSGKVKVESVSENTLKQLEESSRYGVSSDNVEKARSIFINELFLLGENDETGRMLSPYLHLASTPSLYHIRQPIKPQHVAVSWPYIILFNSSEKSIEYRLFSNPIARYNVADLIGDGHIEVLEKLVIDDGAIFILKGHGKGIRAVVTQYRSKPFVVEGDALTYDRINKLIHVLNVTKTDGSICLRFMIYDLKGNILLDKEVKETMYGTIDAKGFEHPGGGALFIVNSHKESLLIYGSITDGIVNTLKVSKPKNIILLPLHIAILFDEGETTIVDLRKKRSIGSYSLPLKLKDVTIAYGTGILGFTDDGIYVIDALNNVYETLSVEGYDKPVVVNTYLFTIIGLMKQNEIKDIIIASEGKFHKINLEQLGIVGVIDIQYSKATLNLITKDGLIVSLSPLYMEDLLLEHQIKQQELSLEGMEKERINMIKLKDIRDSFGSIYIEQVLGELHSILTVLNSELQFNVQELNLGTIVGKAVKYAKVYGLIPLAINLEEIASSIMRISSFLLDHKNLALSLTHITEPQLDIISLIALSEILEIFVKNSKDEGIEKAGIKLAAIHEYARINTQVLKSLLFYSNDFKIRLLKSLVSIKEKSINPIIKETSENILSEIGYDMGAFDKRVQDIITLCRSISVDKSTVDNVISALTKYIRKGELDYALNTLDRLSSFLKTVYNKEFELKERYGESLLNYVDVREFVNRCVQSIIRGKDEVTVSYWVNELKDYETLLIENVEIMNEVNLDLRNSKLIDGKSVMKDVSNIPSLKERNIKLKDLKDKIDKSIIAENELKILMDNLKYLSLKPKSIDKQIELIRGAVSSLNADEALSGIENLKNHIEMLSYINDVLRYIDELKEKTYYSYGLKSILTLKSSIFEDISKDNIIDAYKKAKIVEKLKRLDKYLEPIINSISSNLSTINVSYEVVESIMNTMLFEVINDLIKEKSDSEIISKVQAIKANTEKISSIISYTRMQIEGIAKTMNQTGIDEKNIQSLKSSIQDNIGHLVSSICTEKFDYLCKSYQDVLKGLDKMSNELTKLKQNLIQLNNIIGSLHSTISSSLKDYINKNLLKHGQSITVDEINNICTEILSSANILNNINRFVMKLNSLQLNSKFAKNFVSLANKILIEDVFSYDIRKIKSTETIVMKLIKDLSNIDFALQKLEELGLDLTENIDEQYKLGLNSYISYLESISSLLTEVSVNDKRQLLISKAVLMEMKKINEEVIDSIKLIRDLIEWAHMDEIDVKSLVNDWVREVKIESSNQMHQLIRKFMINIGRTKFKLTHCNDFELFYLTGLEYLSEKIHAPFMEKQLRCTDVHKLIGKYSTKAVEHYCVKGDLNTAMLYGLLSYIIKDPDYDVVFNLLGGLYRNELNLLLNRISKIFNINLVDKHLIIYNYVVSPLLKSDLASIDRFIDNLRTVIDELHNYTKLIRSIYNENETVKSIDIMNKIYALYEISRSTANLSTYLQKCISIEIFNEIEPYRKNEIIVNIYNNGLIPVTVTKISITYRDAPLNETPLRDLKIGPYSMEKQKLIINEMPLEEGLEGREVKLLVNLQISVPELREIAKTDIVLPLSKLIPVSIKAFTPRGGVLKIYEILRKNIKEIELPERFLDALLSIGGNNVVLIGYHKSMNKRVVIKIPGVIVDMITKHDLPTITPSREFEDFVNEVKKATNECNNVAKIISISYNPPFVIEEFIEGVSLRKELDKKGYFNVIEALNLISEIGKTLSYLHSKRIYHNDIRPENVILTSGGKPILIDIGIDDIWRKIIPTTVATTKMSDKGVRTTLLYMHPELSRKLSKAPPTEEEKIKGKIDTFQLGLLLYELLTGYNPYMGGISEPIPPSAITSVPKELDNIILKVILRENEPELSLDEFIQNIDRIRGSYRYERVRI
jgi:hypothetical protein